MRVVNNMNQLLKLIGKYLIVSSTTLNVQLSFIFLKKKHCIYS